MKICVLRKINAMLIRLFLLAFLSAGCGDLSTKQSFENNNSIVDAPQFQLPPCKMLYPSAVKVAQDWSSDAYLNHITVYVGSLGNPRPFDISFGFESETEPIWLNVYVKVEGDAVEYETSEGDYSGAIELFGSAPEKPAIDLDQVSLDCAEAFLFLYENGGNEFFAKNIYSDTRILLILEVRPEGNRQWRAVFSNNISRVSWHIRMDAFTNQILEPIIYEGE